MKLDMDDDIGQNRVFSSQIEKNLSILPLKETMTINETLAIIKDIIEPV